MLPIEQDIESRVIELAVAIGRVGVPFMHQFATLDDFVVGLRAGWVTGDGDYHLPAALVLAGRHGEAETALRAGLDKRAGSAVGWAESYLDS